MLISTLVQLPIPAVMLFTPSLAVPEAALPPLSLAAPLMLLGPPTWAAPATLDLTNRTAPLFAISAGGALYVSHIVRLKQASGQCILALTALISWLFH